MKLLLGVRNNDPKGAYYKETERSSGTAAVYIRFICIFPSICRKQSAESLSILRRYQQLMIWLKGFLKPKNGLKS